MNLEDSDKFIKENESRNRKKKLVLILIILCAVLIAFLFVIIVFMKYKDAQTLKLYVDGTQKNISSTLLTDVGDETYINAKEIAKLLNATYTKGEYGTYTEDDDSCYISSTHEAISIKVDSSTMTKYILNADDKASTEKLELEEKNFGSALVVKSADETKEVYTLERPAKLINGNIYLPFEILPEIFNVQLNVSEKNRIRIYSLANLYAKAKKIAANLGYSTITGEYENVRALIYGLIVVGKDQKYGVINSKGEEVISVKYDEVEFIQNVKEFFVYASNNIGLLSSDGKTIIKPTEYDDISVYNAEKQLYRVEKNGKYGVLNRKGEVVIHAEYSQIGLADTNGKIENSEFEDQVEDPRVLFETCIPVKQGTKYGLFDVDGTELAKTVYDGLGYSVEKEKKSTTSSNSQTTTTSGEEGLLILPESTGVQGIIINQNGGYGVYDVATKRIIIPTVCSRFYSITKAGVTNYYMDVNDVQMDIVQYIKDNNLVSVTEKNIENNENDLTNSNNSNTIVNEQGNVQTNETENVVVEH